MGAQAESDAEYFARTGYHYGPRPGETPIAVRPEGTPLRVGPFGARPSASGYISDAGGGYISGPGSGTSDSILARLSNGEFVVNAGAVSRIGTNYLHSLNRMAEGGLIGSLPNFANGGLVGGGTPVHLHLGGKEFALAGAPSVVNELVVEAQRSQMRSAGLKPSWYGARPSGA
jgi:hypothetical protein